MKKDWEIKKLGEVCEFQGGSQPPKEEWIKENKDGYIRMLQIRDFTQSRNFDIEYVKKTNKLRYCNVDDILLGRYGASVGKVLTGLEGAYNVAILKTIPSDIIWKPFIKYYFSSPLFQFPLLNLCDQRAAQAGFNREDIFDFPFPLPSLEEQKRIVKILDEKFAQLETIKANAQTNLQNAKDLFQSQLTKAFSNTTWEKKRLGDIITLLSGQDFPPERYNAENKGIPYITGASNFNEDGSILINRWTDTPTVIAKRLDVLLVVKGSGYGKTTIADFEEAHIARQIMALRVSPDLERSFLFYYLNCKFDEIKQKGNGVIPGITRSDVLEMSLNLPPLPEQKRIVEELDTLSEKVRQLQEIYTKQIANCEELKQSLLQKAFEGKL